MPLSPPVATAAAFAWVGAVVLAAEIARRAGAMSADSARKAIHVGVGVFVVPTVFLFPDWQTAVVPPLTFAAINFAIHRFRLAPSLSDDPTNLGTTFFPLAFAGVLALFFRPGTPDDAAWAAVAGLLTLALGDPAAALAGKRYGSRRYTIFGHSRTMEGSLAMFLVSAATIAVVLQTMTGLGWHPAVAFGLVTGTAAAGIEAVCPFGSDNLFVPIGTAGTVYALVSISESALGIG